MKCTICEEIEATIEEEGICEYCHAINIGLPYGYHIDDQGTYEPIELAHKECDFED